MDAGSYDFAADSLRMPALKRREYLEALSRHHLMTGVLGVAAAGVTAVEYGDKYNRVTELTIASVLPAIVGGTSLGLGKLLYTLPAGRQLIRAVGMSVAITQTQGFITADTPTVGVGTVIAVGAIAVLSGTATFQNLVVGTVAANCSGTATVGGGVPTAAVPLLIAAADAKTIHFNVADAWAASGDAAAIIAGIVTVHWSQL